MINNKTSESKIEITKNIAYLIGNEKYILLFIFALSFILKAIFVFSTATGPSIVNDEYLYKFNAESIFLLQKYATAHYPPMYPLVLAPALLFESWYEAMLVINAFISSLTVLSAWFLARTIGMRKPVVAAAIAALLPFNAVYPGFLLSENLFIPLFCLAIALAVRGGRAAAWEALLFGAVLAGAHLTKYLFLPAAPLLYIAWLHASMRSSRTALGGRGHAVHFLPLLAYGIIFGAWAWYGHESGFGIRQIFGLDVSTAGRIVTDAAATARRLGEYARPAALLMWSAAYAAFSILAWLPAWGLLAAWASQPRQGNPGTGPTRELTTFAFLVVLLVAGFNAMAVLHSFGAKYNMVQPTKIMGRYLAHLGPPLTVFGLLALESLSRMRATLHARRLLTAGALTLSLAALAWWVIVGKGVWGFPKFFYTNPVNLLDVTIFRKLGYLVAALGAAALPLAMLRRADRGLPLLCAPLAVFLLWFSLGYAKSVPFSQEGLHLRMITSAAAVLGLQGSEVPVVADKVRTPAKALAGAPRFWKLEGLTLVAATQPPDTLDWDKIKTPGLLVTRARLELQPVVEYAIKDASFRIYEINEHNVSLMINHFTK
jgi:hypothetical protein